MRTLLQYHARRQRPLFALLGAALIAAVAAGVSGRHETLGSLLSGLSFFAPIVTGLAVMGGIVSDDLRTGTILLWYQQPGSITGWYLRRYGEAQLLLAAAALLLGTTLGLIGIAGGALSPDRALRVVPLTLCCALLPAAMVFACSAWGQVRDSAIAVMLIMASAMLAVSFSFDDRPLGVLMRALAFPVDSLQIITEGGGAFSVGTAWRIVTSHLVGWTLIGLVGLRVLPRRLAGRMAGE